MAVPESKNQFDFRKSLFLREEFSDAEILVEMGSSTCRFPCQRIILSAASEVFAKMFSSKLAEGETGKVTVNDISPDIILTILRYIYSGRIDLDNWKTAIEVLQAAHRYEIISLVQRCETYLSKKLTLKNACFILDIAMLYDLVELKTKCLTFCSDGGFVILKTRAFTELNAYSVKQILCMQDLNVESEMDVFKALWQWATMECCRRHKRIADYNIVAEFSIFSEYVGFEYMTDADLALLPKSVLEFVYEKRRKNMPKGGNKRNTPGQVEKNESTTAVEPNGIFLQIVKERKVSFPLNLAHCCITANFKLDISPTTSFKGNYISLIRFSLNTDAYLLDFTVMPLKDAQAKCYFQSLHLSSKNKIVAQWSAQAEKKTLELKDIGSHFATLKDNTQIHEFRFEASALIPLEADVEYTIDVDPENHPLSWPRVSSITTNKACDDDIEVLVHSRYCFAITEINFLPGG